MKKKVFLLVLALMVLYQSSAFAYVNNNIQSSLQWLSVRNEYRLDYWGWTGVGGTASGLYVSFTSPTGQFFEHTYDATALTGIFYLTCGGTYTVQVLDGSGAALGTVSQIGTSYIVNGSCSSYSSDEPKNDLGLTTTNNGDGSYKYNWNPMTGATNYDVYKDGSLYTSTTGTSANVSGDGSYNVQAKDSNGNVIGESDGSIRGGTVYPAPGSSPDPGGGGGTCSGCDWITSALSCPKWGDYMGAWSNMIKNAVPPAPNWQEVAETMRDTIIPAMGDELVRRAPEIAKAIGDDLEGREKQVTPPPPLPTFSPSVPTLTDLPNKIDTDLNSGVPNFDPDFSESSPLTIPDPMAWQPDNTDKGYTVGAQDLTAPAYQKTENIQPDKGYTAPPTTTVTSPAYTVTNPTATSPAPVYQRPGESPGSAYTFPTLNPAPNYTTTTPGSSSSPTYQTR